MDGVWAFFTKALGWLETNKYWVFSGVGVAIIGELFRWFATKRRSEDRRFQPRPALAPRNRRQWMLERVWHTWVEGMLEQSLYQVARIELGLTEKLEAIDHPWTLIAQQPERAPRPLPDGIRIVDIFDQFDKPLLLLGEPGSGKTTLLLELTRNLIERAKRDRTHPIPVVFNLSSWAVKRSPLAEWLIDELTSQLYKVPPKVAQAWIADDQVLPLLDGLDEVAEKHRDGCVEEINAFSEEHGLLPLVVCSRSADYEALNKQLRLRGAVTIQPLTREQVKQYLERVGRAVSGVRAALRDDETLWELLDTPLMLSIFALTYQGRMASEITIVRHKGSLEERRAALLDAYIEAMFARRETTAPYTPKQTRQWLGWLAQSMLRHDRSTFYPQWMEHPTLPSETNRHLKREGKRLVVVAIALIVTGISIWSLWKPVWSSEVALSHGLFFGVLFGTPFFVNVLAKSRRRLMPSKPLIALVIAWLIARPSDIEFTELLLGANAQWPLVVLLLVLPVVPIVGILFGEFGGAIIGSCFGLLRGLIERLWNTFRDGGHEVELKRTAIEGMMTGAGQGVWPGFVVGLGLWLFDGLTGIDLNEWLPLWLLVWFAIWIVDILLAGALVVLFLGVLAGLAPALLSGLLGGLFEGLASGLLGGVGLAYLALAVFLAASLGSLDKESLGIHQMGFWMGGSLAAPTVWVISAGFAAGLFGGPLVGIFGAALMMVLLGPFLWLGAKEVMPNVKWPVDDVVMVRELHTRAKHSLLFWVMAQLMPKYVRPDEFPALEQTLLYSVRYGLLAGLSVGFVIGLFFCLSLGLVVGVGGALGGGVAAGLAFGGFAYIRNLLARFVLWRSNLAPLNYIRFLDYAAERVFLRKVDGGYIFVHRLLMEHFARLEVKNSVVNSVAEATQ